MCHTNPDLQSDSDRHKEHLAAIRRPPVSPPPSSSSSSAAVSRRSSSVVLPLAASILHLLKMNPPCFLLVFFFLHFCPASPLPSYILTSTFLTQFPRCQSVYFLQLCLCQLLLLGREGCFTKKPHKVSVRRPGHSFPPLSTSLFVLSAPFLSLCVTLLQDFFFFSPYILRLSALMNFGHFAATDGAAGSRWRQGPGLTKRKRRG